MCFDCRVDCVCCQAEINRKNKFETKQKMRNADITADITNEVTDEVTFEIKDK